MSTSTAREQRRRRVSFLLWLNVGLLLVWTALLVPTVTIWANSVRWVNFLSAAALVLAAADGVFVCLSEMDMLKESDG